MVVLPVRLVGYVKPYPSQQTARIQIVVTTQMIVLMEVVTVHPQLLRQHQLQPIHPAACAERRFDPGAPLPARIPVPQRRLSSSSPGPRRYELSRPGLSPLQSGTKSARPLCTWFTLPPAPCTRAGRTLPCSRYTTTRHVRTRVRTPKCLDPK